MHVCVCYKKPFRGVKLSSFLSFLSLSLRALLCKVVCVVKNFKGKPLLDEIPPEESVSSGPMISQPRMEHTIEKYIVSQVFNLKPSCTLESLIQFSHYYI